MTVRPSPSRLRGMLRRTFRSFEIRNFRLFFAGQFISQVGTWLTTIALTLLVLHRTDSGLAVGLLTACQFGPILLLGVWTGVVADRSDKRRLLITTQTLQMVQSFALATLAFVHNAPLASFYVTALVGGVLLAFDNPARRSFVAEMVPPDYMQNAVTLNTAVMTSSRIVGPAFAGLLVITVGFAWCFTLDALSYIAVIIGLAMMRSSELFQPPVAVKGKRQIRDGPQYVRSTMVLWVPMVMTTILGILSFNFPVVIPLFAIHTLGGTDATYTLMYAVLSVGSVSAALYSAHRHVIDIGTVVVASVSFGTALLVFACAPSVPVAFLLVFFVGFTSVLFMTGVTAIVQVQADASMRGRVLALQAMVFVGTTPIGGPIIGAICDRFNARVGLAIGGVAALSAGAWGYRKAKAALVPTAAAPA